MSFTCKFFCLTSKKYGSESNIVINSIDSGLNNYLGIEGGTVVEGTGDITGASLAGSSIEQTSTGFRTLSGDAFGLSLGVIAPGSDAYISIGNSYVSTITKYLNSILSNSGSLSTRTNTLNQELNEYNNDLVELDKDLEKLRDRYKEQYGAMESVVNSFKSTGEYLDNFMEAQNSD